MEKRFNHINETNSHEVHSLVSGYATVQLVLPQTLNEKQKRQTAHVRNAFENAPLNQTIHVKQSNDFAGEGQKNWAFLLKTAI